MSVTDLPRTDAADAAATDGDIPTGTLALEDAKNRWRPSQAGYVARGVVFALIIGFVLWLPHLLDVTLVPVAATAGVYAIVALSLNVLMGYAGQVSLGHAAFVGVGAFTAGLMMSDMELPWVFAAFGSLLTGAIIALGLGLVALRVRGLYLAIVTIAYGLLAQESLFNIRSLTGGGAGKAVPRPTFAEGNIAYVYFVFGVLVLVWLFDWRLTASKAGRAIRALRDDERVAASWGINVTAFKLLAFVVSGAMAGLAGTLFGGVEQVASPASFQFQVSLTFLLMTVVGGLGSRPGVVIGGLFFAALPTTLEQLHDNVSWWPDFITGQWEAVVGALLLLLTLIQFPGGIAQQFGPVFRWLSFKPLHEEKQVVSGVARGGH